MKILRILTLSLAVVLLCFFASCKKTLKVTFHIEDKENKVVNVKKGSTIEDFDNIFASKADHDFVGWFVEGTDQKWTAKDKVNSSMTLVARFSPIYYITYVTNGAHTTNPEIYKSGTVTLTDPTIEGEYKFIGWNTQADGSGEFVRELKDLTEHITLYAIFEDTRLKITYDLNGGTNSPLNPIYYEAGATLHSPTKLGYTFLRWEYLDEQITKVPTTDKEEVVIKAVFEIETYHITYVLNEGINSSENVETFTVEDLPLKLHDATLENMAFIGWYSDDRKVVAIPKAQSFCKDITLEAKFEIFYNITYKGDHDSVGENPSYYVSSQGLNLQPAIKSGYEFVGWRYQSGYTKSIEIGTTGDIVLESEFKLATYKITYILNGGENHSRNPESYNINQYNIYLREPVKEGYEFIGWTIDGQIVRTILVEWAKDLEVVANFAIFHDLILYLNGGTSSGVTSLRYSEDETVTLPEPLKEGYIFKGWNTNPDGSGNFFTEIKQGSKEDIILYAIWEYIPVYFNLEYELDGGSVSQELPTKYQLGEEVILPDATKDGYTFLGWYRSSDFSQEAMSKISKDAKGDLKLYAKFALNEPKYKINYHLNGGSFTTSTVVYEFTSNEDITLPSVEREGYTFTGWVDEYNEPITKINKGTTYDVVVKANFEASNTFNIRYILNGGTLKEDAIYIYKKTESFKLPLASKEGAEFVGWHKLANLSDDVVLESDATFNKNMVLYAEFSEKIYNINYVSDVLSEYNPTTYTFTTPSFILEDVLKEGYEFMGWFNDAGQKITSIEQGTKGDITLFAKFEAIITEEAHQVKFEYVDSSIVHVQEVAHGKTASEIEVGLVEGLTLVWYHGDNVFDFNTIITEDITLKAKWGVIEEIYNNMFNTPKIENDVIVNREIQTSAGTMNVTWSSDAYMYLNMITGVVNPPYEDTKVTVTGVFKLGEQSFTVKKEVIVAKVKFKDLSTTKPAIGYFYSRVASCEITDVTINALDIINYGFARVNQDCTVSISDLRSIERMVALRKQGIRVLLCIGGYGAAGREFSKAASGPEYRKIFAESILSIIEEYHFDGVDIDWEYPGYETGTDVSIDRPNYTRLMQEVKDTLKAKNPEYLVTAAVPGGKYGYTRYELKNIGEILDYVNLMTYDLQSSDVSTHHTALYNSGSYTPHGSVEQTVEVYTVQGVPKNKLIIGLAFYGRKFQVTSTSSGIGARNEFSSASAITYSDIYDSYLQPIEAGSTTIKRYWDNNAKAPYIYDSLTGIWITYDDPESIKHKCDYVYNNNLGGIMFWDYGEDDTLQLIQAIYDNFKKNR